MNELGPTTGKIFLPSNTTSNDQTPHPATSIQALPPEVLSYILSFLPKESFNYTVCVCKEWSHLSVEDLKLRARKLPRMMGSIAYSLSEEFSSDTFSLPPHNLVREIKGLQAQIKQAGSLRQIVQVISVCFENIENLEEDAREFAECHRKEIAALSAACRTYKDSNDDSSLKKLNIEKDELLLLKRALNRSLRFNDGSPEARAAQFFKKWNKYKWKPISQEFCESFLNRIYNMPENSISDFIKLVKIYRTKRRPIVNPAANSLNDQKCLRQIEIMLSTGQNPVLALNVADNIYGSTSYIMGLNSICTASNYFSGYTIVNKLRLLLRFHNRELHAQFAKEIERKLIFKRFSEAFSSLTIILKISDLKIRGELVRSACDALFYINICYFEDKEDQNVVLRFCELIDGCYEKGQFDLFAYHGRIWRAIYQTLISNRQNAFAAMLSKFNNKYLMKAFLEVSIDLERLLIAYPKICNSKNVSDYICENLQIINDWIDNSTGGQMREMAITAHSLILQLLCYELCKENLTLKTEELCLRISDPSIQANTQASLKAYRLLQKHFPTFVEEGLPPLLAGEVRPLDARLFLPHRGKVDDL